MNWINIDKLKTGIVFLFFLKANKAYLPYRRALIEQKSRYRNMCFSNSWVTGNVINLSFTWSRTKEGHDYWYNLHRKWESCYHKLIHYDYEE